MDLKIKINGEFTKEELQEKLKEFDKPKGEIKSGYYGISLHSDGEIWDNILEFKKETFSHNLSTISRRMAKIMNDLMETKDVLDEDKDGCYIFYNTSSHIGDGNTASSYASDKHFKTIQTAILAAELLNESEDIKGGIKRMGE